MIEAHAGEQRTGISLLTTERYLTGARFAPLEPGADITLRWDTLRDPRSASDDRLVTNERILGSRFLRRHPRPRIETRAGRLQG
jgi:hypothetical protein